jgi:plastocyanin
VARQLGTDANDQRKIFGSRIIPCSPITPGPSLPSIGRAWYIRDGTFAPALTVAAGTTVTWTNEDWAPHTATAEDGSFDSGRLNQGDSFEQTFDEPGTFSYHCSFHPGMMGSIVVT